MFLEDLQKEDPVTYMPQQYVLAGRVAVLLRGLGYALKYRLVDWLNGRMDCFGVL